MAKEPLAAVCGLYCGACGIYRAWQNNDRELLETIRNNLAPQWGEVTLEEIRCDGCLGGGHLTPYCRQCTLRLCAEEKPGVTRCADCPDFPCSRITDFNNDGMRHHAEVLANLRRMAEIGVEAWVKQEEERWRCEQCQAPVDWYARTCDKCGAEQPYRLPTLPRDKK